MIYIGCFNMWNLIRVFLHVIFENKCLTTLQIIGGA